jgi:hypothetical protein
VCYNKTIEIHSLPGYAMITELRRSKRIAEYLPILINAKDRSSGSVLAGPFSGRIIDISDHGACLLMTQVMQRSYHVFHSTREQDCRYLQLIVNVPPDNIPFSIAAHPIWMDLFLREEIRAFKMGIEFLSDPEDRLMKQLREAMRVQQHKRGEWWRTQTDTGSA